MKVHRGKYGQIHLIASLTAGLSRYHDEFAVAVVDEVSSFHYGNVVVELLIRLLRFSMEMLLSSIQSLFSINMFIATIE